MALSESMGLGTVYFDVEGRVKMPLVIDQVEPRPSHDVSSESHVRDLLMLLRTYFPLL